ncbi:MAG: hypothetical protein HYV77_00140 [Candidatus Wildermuthbacteria bacterium]|nr:hypothetical protein [Candidatus Wildermuthbacteria bacterium]
MREPGEPQFVPEEESRKESEISSRAVQWLRRIFRQVGEGPERIALIQERIARFASILGEEEFAAIQKTLESCATIEQEEEFIASAKRALLPLIKIAEHNPQLFESVAREAFVEAHGFIPLNEVISYQIEESDGTLHLHLAPATSLGMKMRRAFVDGLRRLAALVTENPDIVRISATSPLVAEHPALFKRFGFTVEGEISQAEKSRYFPGEEGVVARAVLPKETLLEKYLENTEHE